MYKAKSTIERLFTMFPLEMKNDVDKVISILPLTIEPKNVSGTVIGFLSSDYKEIMCKGEWLKLHNRIYFDEPEIVSENRLSKKQQTILNCIYTLHFDGYIRQKRLEKLFQSDDYFVVPFIISLSGEYVFEVLKVITLNLTQNRVKLFSGFIKENPHFWELTKAKIRSYWNEYYKSDFPCYEDYIGNDFIKQIENNRCKTLNSSKHLCDGA
jgi:hypothetical protein